jgi:type I restriction enzyme S subunit
MTDHGEFAQSYWDRKCATISGLNTINRTLLGAMPFAIPKSDEQAEIVEQVFSHRTALATETAHLTKLRQLKQGLMQDLLTGRVPVKAAD